MRDKDPISIRLSNKELQEIQEFQKILTVELDQRTTIRLMIGLGHSFVTGILRFMTDKRVIKSIEEYHKTVRKAKTQEQVQLANQLMDKEVWPKWQKVMKESFGIIEPFIQQKKAGRPKKERKRGRPRI